MLKRIAVLGESEDFCQALSDVARGKHAEIVPMPPGAGLPPATSATLGGEQNPAASLEAALEVGDMSEEMLKLLAGAIDCREGLSTDSSLRVMDHATRFAKALDLSPLDQLTLERGALIRGIGKTKVPNKVLLKEGLLTYDEWVLIKKHPHLGAELLLEAGVLLETVEIVRNHNECYDGDGYPDGLEGHAIPYLARVMGILDVYCAMTSPRHYREFHATHEEALEHLREEQGKHFDRDLVEVFVSAEVGKTES